MKSKIAIALLIAMLLHTLPVSVFAKEEAYTHASVNIVVSKNGNGYVKTVDALIEENDIYVEAEQLASMTRYSYKTTKEDKGIFRLGMKTVVVDYKNQTLKVNNTKQAFSGAIVSNGKYFLPFSEITPWLNVSVDHDKGCIRLESDTLSYWEVLEDFEPSDYYFFYAKEMGDNLTSVVGLSAVHIFDSLLNLGDVWKKTVTVKGAEDGTTLYDYEVYVDAFREFGLPEDSASEALGVVKKIGNTFSNYSKLNNKFIQGMESEECYEEIAYAIGKLTSRDLLQDMGDSKYYREMLIGEGSKVIGEYDAWASKSATWPENYKYINKAFKMVNAGFACLNIMRTDTASYAKALDYIYLRDNAQTTEGEKLAAKKVVSMMESNVGAVLESVKPLANEFVIDYCENLAKATINKVVEKEIPKSSIGTYLTIVDASLSLFWPINKAYGEVAKLPVYTAIQQNAFDAFSDSRITSAEVSEEALEMSRMTAIIYLKAARKCFEAKDSMMSVWGASGLLNHYYDNVNEMIGEFELCLLAQENDAICDKKGFTEEIRQYLEDLGLLIKNNNTETDTTKPDSSTDPLVAQFLGEWYYYTLESDLEVVWQIRFKDHGEVVLMSGYMYSEPSYYEKGTWSVTNIFGRYILSLSIDGSNCDCIVTFDGNLMKIEKKSGDDIKGIEYGQWYERDYIKFLSNRESHGYAVAFSVSVSARRKAACARLVVVSSRRV